MDARRAGEAMIRNVPEWSRLTNGGFGARPVLFPEDWRVEGESAPNSPPPPRTFDQVYEVMVRIQRGLSPPPTRGDDDAAVRRLTKLRERLLQLEARRTGKYNANRR